MIDISRWLRTYEKRLIFLRKNFHNYWFRDKRVERIALIWSIQILSRKIKVTRFTFFLNVLFHHSFWNSSQWQCVFTRTTLNFWATAVCVHAVQFFQYLHTRSRAYLLVMRTIQNEHTFNFWVFFICKIAFYFEFGIHGRELHLDIIFNRMCVMCS